MVITIGLLRNIGSLLEDHRIPYDLTAHIVTVIPEFNTLINTASPLDHYPKIFNETVVKLCGCYPKIALDKVFKNLMMVYNDAQNVSNFAVKIIKTDYKDLPLLINEAEQLDQYARASKAFSVLSLSKLLNLRLSKTATKR